MSKKKLVPMILCVISNGKQSETFGFKEGEPELFDFIKDVLKYGDVVLTIKKRDMSEDDFTRDEDEISEDRVLH